MIHYSCDCCGRGLTSEEELQYVVKTECRATLEALDHLEIDGDRDYLLEIHEMLERAGSNEPAIDEPNVFQPSQFDLCPECFDRFTRDPFGRDMASRLHFSQN
jgi:hypothetical protein